MSLLRPVVLLLMTVSLALAQVKLQSAQVVEFVRNSAKRNPDKDVAEYLKHITLVDRLSDQSIEDCIQAGAGARTITVLKELAAKSTSLPEPAKAVPKPKPAGPPPPPAEVRNEVLEKVTEYARDYVKNLPNFTCTQVTDRSVDTRNLEQYHRVDRIVETLSYSEGHEEYKVLTQNNRLMQNVSHWDLGGTTSAGEFGTDMKELFAPDTRTEFAWDSWTTLRGRRTHKFSYRVLQSNSRFNIVYEKTQSIIAGYKGYVYVDAEYVMIMRITREGEGIPSDFPIQNVKQVTDYGFTKIGESQQEFLVPTNSWITSKSGRAMVKNETQFIAYRRFGADVKFIPDIADDTPAPKPPQEKEK
jgi:hypothetical protein